MMGVPRRPLSRNGRCGWLAQSSLDPGQRGNGSVGPIVRTYVPKLLRQFVPLRLLECQNKWR